MPSPIVKTYNPNIFSVSQDTEIQITGKHLDQNKYLWFQFRERVDAQPSDASKVSFLASTRSEKEAKFTVPKGAFMPTCPQYVLVWATCDSNSKSEADLKKIQWAGPKESSKKYPKIWIFDLSGTYGYTVPVQGGTRTVIGVINTPESEGVVLGASVSFSPTNSIATTSWCGESRPTKVSVDATIQLTAINTTKDNRGDVRRSLIHYCAPKLSFEGLYEVSVILTANVAASPPTKYVSPPTKVLGPDTIAYLPIFGSPDNSNIPCVPAMTVYCAFTDTPPDKMSPYYQDIPSTESSPNWVSDGEDSALGAEDDFDWSDDVKVLVDGTKLDLFQKGTVVQLLELEGIGRLHNGSPVALRVWNESKGWRCARMNTNAGTYTNLGNPPTKWVVDDKSKAYPTKFDEIFGIYQLIKNPKWDGIDRTQSPCIIETSVPNEIMIGVDKITLVPTSFTRPIDPLFVSPKFPTPNLKSFAIPPQSLVYREGGFNDGLKANTTHYLVYFTGYITYAVPPKTVLSTSTEHIPNPDENISCTCIGSAPLTNSKASSDQLLLAIASEPAVLIRPPNLFYTIYFKKGNSSPIAGDWKPLMSPSLSNAVGHGSGQASIVQVSDTDVLVFQRSRVDILLVYVCKLNLNEKTLTLSDPQGAWKGGIVSLKKVDVIASVIKAFKARFSLPLSNNYDFNLVYDSRFSILYQPANGVNGASGYHVFATPYGYRTVIVHLWYPSLASTPFIDSKQGVCIGVYGTASKVLDSTESDPDNPTSMGVVTGHLGSKINLIVKSIVYGGTTAGYIKVQAQKTDVQLTFRIREWGNYSKGFVTPAGDKGKISGDERAINITIGGVTCTLNISWEGTDTPNQVNGNAVVDGDIWVFQVTPYAIKNLSSGLNTNGKGAIAVDCSGSHLPALNKFSCQFTLTYIASKTSTSDYGSVSLTNFQNMSTDSKDFSLPDQKIPLTSNYQCTIAKDTLNLIVTIMNKPVDGDYWTVTILKGKTSIPVSGRSNQGRWTYPIIDGVYGNPKSTSVSMTCDKVIASNDKQSPDIIDFTYTLNGKDTGTFRLNVQTKASSNQRTGWSKGALSNGLTICFPHVSGIPVVGDSWSFKAVPARAVHEVFSQRPMVAFASLKNTDFKSVWLMVPTKSAGGRIFQYKLPLSSTAQFIQPTSASLLPLRTTLEPHFKTGPDAPTLCFKGLKSIGTTWSAGIKAEVPTDKLNERSYGLFLKIGEDFRPAHSGVFYLAPIEESGASLSKITQWSSFDDKDLITEPKLMSKYANELSQGSTVTDPPKYKPTAWLAIFPQYRFHIGQVHFISEISNVFGLNAGETSATIGAGVATGSGMQRYKSFTNTINFFVDTMIPPADPNTYQSYQTAMGASLSGSVRAKWGPSNGSTSFNPFDKTGFKDVVWDPNWSTDADFDALSKYIFQLAWLRQSHNSGPAWNVATDEGRKVPNYWRFRIGGVTVNEYLNAAYDTACFKNAAKKIRSDLLPKYFSTDSIFSVTFGSPSAAVASVLTESRMEPSFMQLPSNTRNKLLNALIQQTAAGGLQLHNSVLIYLAGRAVMHTVGPINSNMVSDRPMTSTAHKDGKPPDQGEINITKFVAPYLHLLFLAQGFAGVLDEETLKDLVDMCAKLSSKIKPLASPGDRPINEPRSAPRPVVLDGDIAVVPVATNVEQEAIIADGEKRLSPDAAAKLKSIKGKVLLGGRLFRVSVTGLMAALITLDTIGTAGQQLKDGPLGVGSFILDSVAALAAIIQAGSHLLIFLVRDVYMRIIPNAVRLGPIKIFNALKFLEKFGGLAGGVLNGTFGVTIVISGIQELSKNQIANGLADIFAGGFMLTGGAIELVGGLGGGAVLGELGPVLAEIGIEISIVRIWLGGPKAVGSMAEGIAELFGLDLGLSTKDSATNYIRNVKTLAVKAKVSRIAKTSPDPRDNGVEKSDYKIEPHYSVKDVADEGPSYED